MSFLIAVLLTMAASVSPSSLDFGPIAVGGRRTLSVTVNGASFTQGEVSIDGQDRASFAATKNGAQITITFEPVTRGQKLARVKVLIESDGPPYYIAADLNGVGN